MSRNTFPPRAAWVAGCCAGLLAVAAAPASAADVITVPWLGDPNQQHQVWSGGQLILQGVARLTAGETISAATWDPGDGTGPVAVGFGNPRILELNHTYNGLDFQPFTATLSVTTNLGTFTDTFRVIILPKHLDVEVNMAIDHGLWRLHKNQILSSVGGVPTGYWQTHNQAADTASAVLAFQINGHLEAGNGDEDPYVEDVARGLAHTFTELSRVNIGVQTYGDPDTNGNGFGLQVLDGGVVYVGGQVIDAIVASGTPGAIAPTGIATDVLGRTYADIVQDMLDAYSWGQDESASGYRGGWRYNWNSQADNSACQWWAIGAIAAERVWGLTVPQFVKDENLNNWIPASQFVDGTGAGNDGRFGYTNTSPIDVNGMNTTPSGVVQLNECGVLKTDARHLAAQKFMIRNWSQFISNTRIYGYFATAKAMRLSLPTPVIDLDAGGAAPFDWYGAELSQGDAFDGLARRLVNLQQADDSWDAYWVVNDLATAWAIVILSPTIVQLAPHAICEADPSVTGVANPVDFDGARSFHTDPARKIVSYEWDFEGDGIFDATGAFVTHTYSALGTYNAKLRVTDDNNPPLIDEATCTVLVTVPPFPPDSDPGRHYQFCLGVNEPFILDGTGSNDIDGSIVAYGWDYDPQPLDNDFDDATTATVDVTAFFTALGPGIYDVGLRVQDDLGNLDTDFTTVTVYDTGDCPVNDPPVCPDGVKVTLLPDGKYYELNLNEIAGVTDPGGLPVTIVIDAITQDEPVVYEDDPIDCDGYGVGTDIAFIKAEAAPYKKANGRVYQIHYTATNSGGLSCSNYVTVCVPKKRGYECRDTGQLYDSTQGCED